MSKTHTPRIIVSFVLATCIVSAFLACSNRSTKVSGEGSEILSDRDQAQPTEGPIELQEPSGFPVDDSARAYATLADSDDRTAAPDKPIELGEPKPTK